MTERACLAITVILVATAAGRAAEPVIAIDEQGRLSVEFEPDRLVAPEAVPAINGFRWEDGTVPDYASMAKAETSADQLEGRFVARHEWGGFEVDYRPSVDHVDLVVRFENATSKSIGQFRLLLTGPWRFPETPAGDYWEKGWDQMTDGGRPGVVVADYGRGAVAACLPDNPAGMLVGFTQRGRLTLDGGHVPAGETREWTVSLRFGSGRDAAGDAYALADDVYRDFAEKHPLRLRWPDRRPIATLFPASDHLGAGRVGATKNPRGWIVGTPTDPVDVTTPHGRAEFRAEMMKLARQTARICRDVDAQGVIVWCVEGQQYPHNISYVGSPDKLPELAPEMDEIADEWFRVLRDAGLRTGVCLRPQQLVEHPQHDPAAVPGKTPHKHYQQDLLRPDGSLDEEATIALLDAKIRYARDRWGCSLFYVDTNVVMDGVSRWTLHPPRVYAELARRFPDALIVPELEEFAYWADTAPVGATPAEVRRTWPESFSVNLLQGIDLAKPEHRAAAESWVEQGDVLLFHGWYEHPNNKVLKEIYQARNKR